MGDNFLIDLSSPSVNSQRASLVPSVSSCLKNKTDIQPLIAYSSPSDNNPFDMVVHQVEIKEADENDPFEMAFQNAYGCKEEKTLSAEVPNSLQKSAEVPVENHSLKGTVSEISETVTISGDQDMKESVTDMSVMAENNLDDVQPPDSLLNLSLDFSEKSYNITISDTLHLSDMSDIRLSPTGKTDSPLEERCLGRGSTFSEEGVATSSFPANGHIVESENEREVFYDKSGSFHESPVEILCELKSEESVKALIENRIKKCIAKALNDSHQQLRNVSFSENANSTLLQTSFRPSRESLRTSTSVPQNLHLLEDTKEIQPKTSERHSLLPFCGDEKVIEDLQIPFLDHSLSNKNANKVADMPAKQSLDLRNSVLNAFENIKLETDSTSVRADWKSFDLPDVVNPQRIDQSPRRFFHKTNGPETRNHRRSLSCDFIPSQQLPKMTSPPKLPPLPLSSETIRDLNLCSKHSPQKAQGQNHTPGDISAKLNRPVPLPACAQPRLVLRKKQSTTAETSPGSLARAGKGPMKATLPVQNMTKYIGSPRTSVQPQSRKTTGTPRRQSAAESPAFQKAKLCPLAASTPSNVVDCSDGPFTRLANPVAQQPRRILGSGIPSPSRKGIKLMPVASQLPQKSSSHVVRNSLQLGVKPGTPTKGMSPTLQRRGAFGNPRVLLDRNNGSPAVTPVRKLGTHSGAKMPNNRLPGMGKENMAYLR